MNEEEKTESTEAAETPETPETGSAEPEASQADAAEAEAPGSEAPEAPAANTEAPSEEPSSGQQGEGPAAGPDWKEMYARMRADYDNFRKRTERDRDDLAKFAAADVLKGVLSTVDDLARALDGAKDKKDDPFVSGVQLVYDGLLKTLADHGATPLDSMGEPFDANYHEALATLPSPDVPEGNVMTEVKRGWLLNGKLLRAAQVVVSAGAAKE